MDLHAGVEGEERDVGAEGEERDAGVDGEERDAGAEGEERGDGAVVVLNLWDEDDEVYSSDFDNDDDIDEGDDDASMVEESSEEEDEAFEILYPDTSSSSESEDEPDNSKPQLPVLITDNSVVQHGVRSSVRHHQCCDALAAVDCDENKVIVICGQYAILYDVRSTEYLASTRLEFEPYSIAQYGVLFAAGGDGDITIYQIVEESDGTFRFHPLTELSINSFHVSAMNNGLRFGLCGKEVKLLVANQDCHVYAFSVPSQYVQPAHHSSEESTSEARRSSCSGSRSNEACASLPEPGSTMFALMAHVKSPEPSSFLCTNLRGEYPGTQSERFYGRLKMKVDGQWALGEHFTTDGIGRFSDAVNCALSSPDGAWIAVVGDGPNIEVLDHQSGYSISDRLVIPFIRSSRRVKSRPLGGDNLRKGSQYAVWNSSSTMLAASSDALHMVRVWAIRRGLPLSLRMATRQTPSVLSSKPSVDVVATLGGQDHIPRPCLALQFDPLDENILYFVERAGRLHAMDVRCFRDSTDRGKAKGAGTTLGDYVRIGHGQQTVYIRSQLQEKCLPTLVGCTAGHQTESDCIKVRCTQFSTWRVHAALAQRPWPTSGKMTGLVVSAKHGVLVSCRDRILQYHVRRKWSQDQHSYFPPSFKRAVAFLLLASNCAARHLTEAANDFCLLPREIIHTIIEKAAMPLSAWTA